MSQYGSSVVPKPPAPGGTAAAPPSHAPFAPVPPRVMHRNPNQVAKAAAEMSGGVNPLLTRLYSSTGGANAGGSPGVPNILSAAAQRQTGGISDPQTSASTTGSTAAAAQQPMANPAGKMPLYKPPAFKEADLRVMLAKAPAAQLTATSVVPKRRQTPPTRLEPLSSSLVPADAGAAAAPPPAALMTTAATPPLGTAPSAPEEAPQHAEGSPLAVVSRFRTAAHANTPKEFTYLVMRPRGVRDMYNPYDLVVVPHNDIQHKQYFTVSAAGVTKFDEGESEFVGLKAWEREFRIYHKLAKLDVFKLYKKWKSFDVWRKLVRRTTMQAYKTHLSENLFILNPDLSRPLRDVRDICLDFQNKSMYVPSTETRELKTYVDQHMTHLRQTNRTLENTTRKIRDILERACKEAMQTSAVAREKEMLHGGSGSADEGRKGPKSRGAAALEGARAAAGTDGPGGNSHKPSYIELSQKRAVCRRLTNYIRLCDYMIINSLAGLAMKAVRTASEDLQFPRPFVPPPPEPDPKDKKRGGAKPVAAVVEPTGPFVGMIFFNDVLFENQSLIINPALDDVTSRVNELIKEYIKSVTAVPRLAQMEAFKVYTQHAMVEHSGDGEFGLGPDVGEMVMTEEEYATLTKAIRHSLVSGFKKVEQYTTTYEKYRHYYLENLRLTEEEIRKGSLETFRKLLDKYRAQAEDIEKIPTNKDVGLFTVQTERLKTYFRDCSCSPTQCQEMLHKLLPLIARDCNKALLDDLYNCNKYLEKEPTTVEGYVEYTQYVSLLEQRMKDLETDFDFLRELFQLLEFERIAVSEDDEQTFRTGTRMEMDRLRNLMQQIEDNKESRARYFARNIEEQLEGIRDKMGNVQQRSKDRMIEDENADVAKVIEYVQQLQQDTDALLKREKELTRFQDSFGIQSTPIMELRDEVQRDVNDKVRLWVGIRDFDIITKEFEEAQFAQLEPVTIRETIEKYDKIAKQVARTQGTNLVVVKLKEMVQKWGSVAPLVTALKNDKLGLEHKKEIDTVIGPIADASGGNERTLSEIPDFTLGMLLRNDVMLYIDRIRAISQTATEEWKLDQEIKRLDTKWAQITLETITHKDSKDMFVLTATSVEEITQHLEESLIQASMLGASKYCTGALKIRVDDWENNLRRMQETLDKWLEFQRAWMYLENIFSSSEIRSQWKSDNANFQGPDVRFRSLMKAVNEGPNAKHSLLTRKLPNTNVDVLSFFDSAFKVLEEVRNSLERKLEEKRRLFPRFYFLSNEDLLDVLAKAKLPELIEPHMLKMFDAIKSLTLTGSNDITHINSMEGEKVELTQKNIKAGRGQVEQWLGALEKEMFSTMRKLAKTAVEDYETCEERTTWIFRHPCQLVLIVSQIFWTRNVEQALDVADTPVRMKASRERNHKQLADLAGLTGRKLSKVQRILLSTLITLDVHGRDLVDEMSDDNVQKSSDFGWTKQLRAYWEVDPNDAQGNLFIRQNNSNFTYGYEYLGAQGRLVITPLTDRIYMTITGALKLYLGAAPAGPAGTGKTETVKDLAKNLARQCIVYNCSDGVTYKMMEKFFLGLIQTGAWTCLDEFNRINIEVLSVIASQVLEIKIALQTKVPTFTFQGITNVPIRDTYGAFITMNPGYAGRTELPDNLKILFRPVAVMTPDFRMIAEVILYSEGFKNAKDLSLKITQLYKLSSEQLSPQDHYDFGMRALKSILVMAGDLKRSQPDVEEDLTLIVACNDSNVPKFVADDVPLFNGIMQDLFPGASFPKRDYPELLPAMHNDMEKKALDPVDTWVAKCIQFYETLIVRHGVMLVGVTLTGKTEARNNIANALAELSKRGSHNPIARPVHQYIMNPKSISMQELYGSLDAMTNEWKDGHLAKIAKECAESGNKGNQDHSWIVLDGPVDTLWIESMNSVLDDSKLLCLDNGDRIKFPNTIHMLFEVADLSVASPATVSRCGMVYVDGADLPWTAYLKKWSNTTLAKYKVQPLAREFVESMFLKYIPLGQDFYRKNRPSILIDAGTTNVAISCCELFTALLAQHDIKIMEDYKGEALDPEAAHYKERNELVRMIFAFSFIWAIGGNFDSAGQDAFDALCRDNIEGVAFPGHGSVFDFVGDFAARKFIPWESRMREFVYDSKTPFFNILVPTRDTVRFSYLAKTLIQVQRPVLFSGQTGVGKSVIMNDMLVRNKADLKLVVISFQFSAQSNSMRTQELIESKLKAKRKNLLGVSPPNDGVILFIDDLNMPALEKYGASPPIELLRQMMGNGGFYDRDKKNAGFWKTVQDVTVVAACGPPEGGRNPVTARLTRMFNLLQIPTLSEDSMKKIFVSILSAFFTEKNFVTEVRDLAKSMITGAVDIFNRIREDLRPRPSTPHYTFNLRDLAKVCQGLMQVIPRICNSAAVATRLWIHEVMRCFYDRLTSHEDRQYFKENLIMDSVKRLFPGNAQYADLFEGPVPIMWGDFLRPGCTEEDRVYEEVSDMKKLYKLFDDYLDDFNSSDSTTTMNLVFFTDHIQHLARIVRIIRQPRGNALLVGVGGSGKQSLTRLATFIAGYLRFEIAVSKSYSINDFREKLLELYDTAGLLCKPLTFLLNDTQIVNEGMLEDVNNILNSGEVPALFPPDERDKRITRSTEAARDLGITARDEIWSFFIGRVRDNFHIVLCMSPVGDAFRNRCRQFPSLTNCCVIDWFDEWPREALLAVARRLTTELDLGQQTQLREPLVEMCVDVHESTIQTANEFWEELRRRYYITPTSYLEFISLYTSLLADKTAEVGEQLSRLMNGRAKMKDTNETIAVMKKQLEEKQPLLEKAAKDNAELEINLNIRRDKASVVKVSVAAQEAEAAQQQKGAAELEAGATARLSEAQPALDAAEAALDSIEKKDFDTLKSYNQPPAAVFKTVRIALVFFEPHKQDIEGWSGAMDWKGCREFLGFNRLIPTIKSYDKDNIRKDVIMKARKWIEDDQVTPEMAEKASNACKGLCLWFNAMIKYYEISLEVAPLRKAQAEAQRELDATNKLLNEARSALKAVEDELSGLEANLQISRDKSERLGREVETCSKRLVNAESLSDSLKSESVRWETNIGQLEAKLLVLPVEIFFSSACVAYFGAFTARFRKRLVALWIEKARARKLTISEDYSLVSSLGDPMEILQWQICSLPTDETSTENAIIVSMSTPPRRWPLLIDPQGQASKWIQQRAKLDRAIRTVKLTDSSCMRTIEAAIRNGTSVLIDDVGETLDPALEPLLQRQIFLGDDGVSRYITLSATTGAIQYNPNFRLYICTKLSNPTYLPDVSIKVTLVNFTVTMDGLENQMLGEVVAIERKDIEEEKNKTIQTISDGQKQLKKMEESILEKLKTAKGNILDNEQLIQELKLAQRSAHAVSLRQSEAQASIVVINKTRELYRPVANRCSILFFVLADLALIDPMYQYSLDYFKRVVTGVVEATVKPEGFDANNLVPELFDEHLANLKSRITEATFMQVCRGLFNKDKTSLSLLICTSIARNANDITELEWQYLIRATALAPSDLPPRPPTLSWVSQQQWELIYTLSKVVPVFNQLLEDVNGRAGLWKSWCSRQEPHLEVLPGGGTSVEDADGTDWENHLSGFQKILLVRAWRAEKLFMALNNYIRTAMGKQYVEARPFDMQRAYEDSSPSTPIIFILSQGSDPMNMLQAFAAQQRKRLQYVALGQGQGDNAKKIIDSCKRSGEWAMLQNCHLSKTFMPELENQVILLHSAATSSGAAAGGGAASATAAHAPDPNFRLFLTSMPSDFFPVFVLQNSIKLTNEAPTGLKANMLRCYNEISPENFEVFKPDEMFPDCSKEHAYKKLMYGLCFFHSVSLERKKFGPLGWNVRYEWNDTDFHVSAQWIRLFLQEQKAVPWDSLEYIVGQINYGGRVTDPLDRNTLMTVLRIYLNPQILKDGYTFSASGKYRAPERGDLDHYRRTLSQMSEIDDPEVFGMHENANLRFQLQNSELLMNTILSVQPRIAGKKGDGVSPEELVSTKCADFEAILPSVIDRETEAGPNTFTTLANGLPNSLSTVLGHELVKYNKLLSVMKHMLSEMQRALKGLTVISEELDRMFYSFLNDKVPTPWGPSPDGYGYATLKPLGSWFKELLAKVTFIRNWVRNGEPPVFWMPGFFNPSSFMTGILQAFARQHLVSVDKLGFAFRVVEKDAEDITVGPESGAYIHGMYGDAWRWDADRGVMADSLPGEPYAVVPVLHFLPEPYHKTPQGSHRIPLYRTTIRAGVISSLGASSNFILNIEAATDKTADYWILKGAACCCALSV